MNKKQIAITLGIMCLLLTIALSVQIKTMNNASSTASQSFVDNKLRDEVLKWKEKYDNIFGELKENERELEKVRQQATQNDKSSSAKDEQLKINNMILGLSDVKGSGIVIVVQDAKPVPGETIFGMDNIRTKLVHNDDLLAIVSELRNAEAEAIEINGQRIVNTSAITCEGNVIRINGEKISSPFTIKAIGSQELLIGIDRVGSYLQIMKDDGIIVSLNKDDNIEIGKYTGVMNYKYAKSISTK